MKVSIFENIRDPKQEPRFDITLDEVYQIIKEGDIKEEIEHLRSLSDQEYKEEKKSLPYVTFAGTFSKRNKESILSPSGLVCLDFDKISKEDLSSIKDYLKSDPSLFMLFLSPSGKGLKAMFRTPKAYNDKDYKKCFKVLEDEYDYLPGFDPNVKDITRACFLSYDPDIYYNPEATEIKVNDLVITDKRENLLSSKKTKKDFSKYIGDHPHPYGAHRLSIQCERIATALEGEKDKTRINAFFLVGGFIAGNVVNESIAKEELLRASKSNSSLNEGYLLKQLERGLKAGKMAPIFIN